MKTLNRRSFLKGSLITGATLSLPARFWAQVPGANEDIRAAVIGFGGRGGGHISELEKIPGVRVAALCDCDRNILDRAVKRFKDKGQEVKGYVDVRELMADQSIDVVTTATPNHWHALITVWGCQAGKDVYVEKPTSHNIWEGRQAVEAARKYNRIVQSGTQSRSRADLYEAWDWLREGHLGKIKVARGLCYKRRPSIGKTTGPQPVPPNIDYNLWCGPAPLDPPRRNSKAHGSVHYDWHWFWAYGNGDMGNQGIHEMDKARWALGKMEMAPSVFSIGGRLGYEDDGETANTQMCVFNYGDVLLIFETRGLPSRLIGPDEQDADGKRPKETMDKYRGESIGQVIECEGGYTNGSVAWDNDGKEIKRFSGKGRSRGGHMENFIKAVRSRKKEDLNADILEGHLSSGLCHQGNISHRLGRLADPEEIRAAVKQDSAAQETLARMEEHLAANGVDLKKTRLTIGPTLKFDPKAERFIGNDRANALLSRNYRAPFIVPEKV